MEERDARLRIIRLQGQIQILKSHPLGEAEDAQVIPKPASRYTRRLQY